MFATYLLLYRDINLITKLKICDTRELFKKNNNQ